MKGEVRDIGIPEQRALGGGLVVGSVRVVEDIPYVSTRNTNKETYVPRWRGGEIVSLSEFVVFQSSQSVVN